MAPSLLLASTTAPTVSDDGILLHSAEKGIRYEVVHLPEFWPASIALVVFPALLSLKRRQDRNYSARPLQPRAPGPAQCEECGRSVSSNVRRYSAERADTFGGLVLCYEHQRPCLQR